MAPRDKLLHLDMGLDDCFYRFQRDFDDGKSTVIYVYLKNLDILAPDRQTYGPEIIQDLKSKVDIWDQQWITLTVFREDTEVRYSQDQWQPHFLPLHIISTLSTLPRLNALDIVIRHRLKNAVSIIELNSKPQILKVCPFGYQLPYFTREIKAYNTLSERGCRLIPRLSAYVFERSEDQIIGFTCEQFQGTVAGPGDYEECKQSLRQLHSYGVIHGDLNKYNIMITAEGPRFFDLETSVLDTDGGISKEDFSRRQEEELDGLQKALRDEEGWGKPRSQ